jgi:hypothetical protein
MGNTGEDGYTQYQISNHSEQQVEHGADSVHRPERATENTSFLP